MELLKDKNIEEQFHTLVKKFLTKDDSYDTSRFIGGMPITLERSDMHQLMYKINDNYKYNVTQKVDGTRVLMYIGYDNSSGGTKQRTVCFIDRNMKIYTIRNSERAILPYVNTRELLLDGELVFFDADGNSHKELDSRFVKGVSFMAFDILYGVENIDVDSGANKIVGQSFSMIVPLDNVLKTFPWTYINRYDILYKLIVPGNFNKNEPMVTTAFKNVPWFNVEIKPIYFLNALKDKKILYNESKTGYLQTLLNSSRRDFYNNVISKYPDKTVNVFIKKALTLDGLIFTPSDMLYNIGTLNKFSTTQYKWKPTNEQTVDFQMRKVGNNTVELLTMKGGNIVPFQQNFKAVTIDIPTSDFQNNSVGEFSINQITGEFKFKEYRRDKKTPNSIKTVMNVINSFKNPVNINDLYYFLNLGPSSNEMEIKKVLEYSSKSNLLQCLVTSKDIPVLDNEMNDKITNTFKMAVNDKEIETELRLGVFGTKNFIPDIDRDIVDAIIKKLNFYKFNSKTEDFVDVYSDKIRTRYMYSNELSSYILSESIIKTRISNADIRTKYLLNFDVRFATSKEAKVKEYNLEGDSYKKYRRSFIEPNGIFRVDITSIMSGTYKDRKFTVDEKVKEKFQVEIEILKDNINANGIMKFLSGLLRF